MGPAPPLPAGWAYSDTLVRVLEQYKARFPWLWVALEQDAGSGMELALPQIFPGLDKEAAVAQVG